MNKRLTRFYAVEINDFLNAVKEQRIQDAWKSLERAHILGQFFLERAFLYSFSHAYFKFEDI